MADDQETEADKDVAGKIDGQNHHRTETAIADLDTPTEGEDSVKEELEIARRHADPSKSDKIVDGGDRVSTEKGGNPQE